MEHCTWPSLCKSNHYKTTTCRQVKIPRARNLHFTLKGNNGWKMSDETLGWRLSDGQACLQIQRRPISHGAAASPKWLPRSKQWLVLREESARSVKYFIFNTQVWKTMYTFLHSPQITLEKVLRRLCFGPVLSWLEGLLGNLLFESTPTNKWGHFVGT